MKITKKWLEEKYALSDVIEWFKKQKETDSVKVIQKLIKEGNLDWANWLISRLLNRKNNLKYSVFSAKLAFPNFEKAYPKDSRLQVAIDATVLCIENRTTKNMNAAKSAADSVFYAADSVFYAAKPIYYVADSVYDAADSVYYVAGSTAESAAAYYAAMSAFYAAMSASSAAYSAAFYAFFSAYYAADSARRRTFKKIIKYGIKIYKEQLEVQK